MPLQPVIDPSGPRVRVWGVVTALNYGFIVSRPRLPGLVAAGDLSGIVQPGMYAQR
jgi:hypothetical protein